MHEGSRAENLPRDSRLVVPPPKREHGAKRQLQDHNDGRGAGRMHPVPQGSFVRRRSGMQSLRHLRAAVAAKTVVCECAHGNLV